MNLQKKDRPKIKLEFQSIDSILEAVAALSLVALLLLPFLNYGQMPDEIPTHFNVKGVPDGFGGKGTIWLLPGLGLIFYIGFLILNRYPHTFNYPVKITPDNALKQYTLATRIIRGMKAVVILLFAILTHGAINVALGKSSNLGSHFILLIVALTFGLSGYYIFKSLRA